MLIPLKENNVTNLPQLGITARIDGFALLYSERYFSLRHKRFVLCCCWNTTKTEFQSTHQTQLTWEGGGEGTAWHLLFTFQATVESSHGPSREGCVHLIHPRAWMPAQRFCSFVSCSPNAHTRTQDSQHADAITSQIKFLIWGPQTLLNRVQGGLCLFHKWLWIVNSPFSCLLPAS